MLANPFPPSHQPNPGADLSLTHDDPFQSLYSSLANLCLTTSTAAIGVFPPSSATTTTTTTATSPPTAHAVAPSLTQNHPAPTPSSLIPVTPLFPPGDNVVFAHSSFFYRSPAASPTLPTPSHVREQAFRFGYTVATPTTTTNNDNNPDNSQGGNLVQVVLDDDHDTRNASDKDRDSGAKLVAFPSLGLLVKYGVEGGPGVGAAEGKAMMFVHRALQGLLSGECGERGGVVPVPVPVPEVFGWRRDAGTRERFVYMALPEGGGEVLAERWEGMGQGEREGVCGELREVVRQWRRLRLGGAGFVGSVDHGPLQDEVFRGCTMAGAPPPGPFPTVAAFHDYFVAMAVTISQSRQGMLGDGQVRYIPQHLFPADAPVVFTHGALHPRNIIVSAGPNPRVVAILGWEQAGWYPAYWELCKARWECSRQSVGDWESRYLPWILDAEGLNAELQDWHVGALCQYWEYFVGLM